MKTQKIAALLACAALAVSVCGCGSKKADEAYETGRAALYGLNGAEMDLQTAFDAFTQAKEQGVQDANFYLGVLCDWYNVPERNYETAKTYYKASGDNPYASLALAWLYYNGEGGAEDKEKAAQLFQDAIDGGHAEGYEGLAQAAYDAGDYETAFQYYGQAAEEGKEPLFIASATNNLGWMYHEGQGTAQDYEKALASFEKAAGLGSTMAMVNEGVMYFQGKGVTQDYERALELFEKADEMGNEIAGEYAEITRGMMEQ